MTCQSINVKCNTRTQLVTLYLLTVNCWIITIHLMPMAVLWVTLPGHQHYWKYWISLVACNRWSNRLCVCVILSQAFSVPMNSKWATLPWQHQPSQWLNIMGMLWLLINSAFIWVGVVLSQTPFTTTIVQCTALPRHLHPLKWSVHCDIVPFVVLGCFIASNFHANEGLLGCLPLYS